MNLIVDLHVHDLKRAVQFYSDILELPCRTVSDNWAAISVGNAEIHLYVKGGVKNHVEFYVDDLDEEVINLTQKGVNFVSGIDKPEAISVDKNLVTTFPWGRTAFFMDSEGNELAIVKDSL